MKQAQKVLVQTSFAQVAESAETTAALFYQRLFELDPALRPLFKSDLREQERKLMQMLAVAVSGLDNPAALKPALQRLGARHIAYGVQSHHYQTVGAALLWTLEQGLGAAFTDEMRAAWTAVYTLVSETMQQTMQEAAVAA
ncbi:MAG: hemin receptor [Acidobacteria bacterium]|nr:hemin receptor [Acidobacteriota bacterium]MBI3424073.1 hemin receptor [Acidobacteriota bacterium]